MNTKHGIYAFLLLSALLSWQAKDTDAFGIIGKAIVIKAIIAAKIIKGAAAIWIGRGGFGGFGGAGGAGGAGGIGGVGGTGGIFGWGRRRREVGGRKAQMTDEDVERVFAIILNMDEQFCMARIVCEIHATKDEKQFGELGFVIREIFQKYNSTNAQPHSAAAIYKQAATVGSLTNAETCVKVYSACNLEPEQIDSVIDSANTIN